jgi:hypothetical protein
VDGAKPPARVEEFVAVFERDAAAVNASSSARRSGLGEEREVSGGRCHGSGRTSVGQMILGFLFDAIHHRGQLSTY